MDLASMALSISNWKMSNFQTDLSIAVTKEMMDTSADAAAMLVDGIKSAAPSMGMMDILV